MLGLRLVSGCASRLSSSVERSVSRLQVAIGSFSVEEGSSFRRDQGFIQCFQPSNSVGPISLRCQRI